MSRFYYLIFSALWCLIWTRLPRPAYLGYQTYFYALTPPQGGFLIVATTTNAKALQSILRGFFTKKDRSVVLTQKFLSVNMWEFKKHKKRKSLCKFSTRNRTFRVVIYAKMFMYVKAKFKVKFSRCRYAIFGILRDRKKSFTKYSANV